MKFFYKATNMSFVAAEMPKKKHDRNFFKRYYLVIQYLFYQNICYLRSQFIIWLFMITRKKINGISSYILGYREYGKIFTIINVAMSKPGKS